jgi:hypothetical protein
MQLILDLSLIRSFLTSLIYHPGRSEEKHSISMTDSEMMTGSTGGRVHFVGTIWGMGFVYVDVDNGPLVVEAEGSTVLIYARSFCLIDPPILHFSIPQ